MRTASRLTLRWACLALLVACASAPGTSNIPGVASSGPVSSQGRSDPRGCLWAPMRTPNPAPARFDEELEHVAVISPEDAWATGTAYVDQEGGAARPLLLRWDGHTWRSQTDAFAGQRASDVSASSPANVWIVGGSHHAGLAERWDGSRWILSRPASPPNGDWRLTGVAALSPTDVWAVGEMRLGDRNTDGFGPLAEHWDGHAWRIVPTPSLQPSVPGDIPYGRFDAVAASGPGDVWAAGETSIGPPADASETLVEHWDGQRWIVASTPDIASPRGIAFDHLFSVAADSPSDVWAVGSFGTTEGYGGRGDHPLVLHWNGTRWVAMSTPPQQHAPLRWARLSGTSTDAAGHAWAVGRAGSGGKERPIATAWTNRWTSTTVAHSEGKSYNDIATDARGTFTIAVASREAPNHSERTLIERCSPA